MKNKNDKHLHSAMNSAPKDRPLDGVQDYKAQDNNSDKGNGDSKGGHDYSHVEAFMDSLEPHEVEHAMKHGKKKLNMGNDGTESTSIGLDEPTMDDFENAKKQQD